MGSGTAAAWGMDYERRADWQLRVMEHGWNGVHRDGIEWIFDGDCPARLYLEQLFLCGGPLYRLKLSLGNLVYQHRYGATHVERPRRDILVLRAVRRFHAPAVDRYQRQRGQL